MTAGDYQCGAAMHNGELQPFQQDKVAADLRALYPEGTRVTVSFKKQKPRVSTQAQGFYFGAIIPAACQGFNDLGYEHSPEIVRALLESESPYNKALIELNGEHKFVPVSMSEMLRNRKDEFHQHVDWCIRFIAEHLGVVVEDPEQWKARMYGPETEQP